MEAVDTTYDRTFAVMLTPAEMAQLENHAKRQNCTPTTLIERVVATLLTVAKCENNKSRTVHYSPLDPETKREALT